MHVINPATYRPRPAPKPRRKLWRIVLVLIVLTAAYNYLRPLPAATVTVSVSGLAATAKPTIAWPAGAQAAVGAPGYGILATSGSQTPIATASIAKVITALCVLQKQPLDQGQSGPAYAVTAADVAIYNNYAAQDGSVAAVAQGEKLTEYQALQALMLPSANNVADSLVRWVFGSQTAYKTFAAQYLAAHGLNQTTVGSDASGFRPDTTSTASDLTKLGLLALKSPVLLEIADQKSTVLPVAGVVHNYNTALGVNGITGLKTGDNDADPGAFLFTATVRVGDKDVPVTGAVMDAGDLQTALIAATRLSSALQTGFEQVTIAQSGTAIGALHAGWGASSPIVTSGRLQLIRWKDTALSETHREKTAEYSGVVGSLQISAPGGSVQTAIRLQHPLAGPSFWWRLTRH